MIPREYDAEVRGGATSQQHATWAPSVRDLYFGTIDAIIDYFSS